MKKITLALSLLLAGASAYAADPNTMPALSTSHADAKLYAISSYRGNQLSQGTPATEAAILAGTEVESQLTTVSGTIDENSMWYVVAGPEEGTYYVCNYGLWEKDWPDDNVCIGKGQKPVLAFSPEEGGSPMYILPNGKNDLGLVISFSDVINTGSDCLDKFNSGVGITAGWNAEGNSDNDWQGVTWSFIEVDLEATPEENWAKVETAWNVLHEGPIKTDGIAQLDKLIATNPWTAASFEDAKKDIEALENPTAAEVSEIINDAIAAAQPELLKAMTGKSVSIRGVRTIAEGKTNTYLGQKEVTVKEETVEGLGMYPELLGICVWNCVAAEGGFLLQNNDTKAYIAKLPVQVDNIVTMTEEADSAAVFTPGFRNGANVGVTLVSKVAEESESTEAISWGLNVNGAGVTIVNYSANDNGSTFIIDAVDPAGIENVAIESANGPVEFYTIQGVRVNPETAGPGLYIRRQGNKAVKVLVR